jgi:hypothetical protein
MAHPEHQPYWFRSAAACGLGGLAMIALAGTLARSNGHLHPTDPLLVVA